MKKSILVGSLRALALAGLTLGAIQVRAQIVNLYVGIDSNPTLTLPLVTDGRELIAAPEANGPWEVIPFPPAPDTTYSQTGTTYEGTYALTGDHQFHQLRRVQPAQ